MAGPEWPARTAGPVGLTAVSSSLSERPQHSQPRKRRRRRRGSSLRNRLSRAGSNQPSNLPNKLGSNPRNRLSRAGSNRPSKPCLSRPRRGSSPPLLRQPLKLSGASRSRSRAVSGQHTPCHQWACRRGLSPTRRYRRRLSLRQARSSRLRSGARAAGRALSRPTGGVGWVDGRMLVAFGQAPVPALSFAAGVAGG